MVELAALFKSVAPDLFSEENINIQNSEVSIIYIMNYLPFILTISLFVDQSCDSVRSLLEESFYIRREKSVVAKEIPEKVYCKLMVPMTPLQRKLCRLILRTPFTSELEESTEVSDSSKASMDVGHHLSQTLTRICRVLNHPKLFTSSLSDTGSVEVMRCVQ